MDPTQPIVLSLQQLTVFMGITTLLLIIPIGSILRRVGLSPAWALLGLVPILGFPALWIFAFIRWPRDAQPQP
jgi:hypothetical protein